MITVLMTTAAALATGGVAALLWPRDRQPADPPGDTVAPADTLAPGAGVEPGSYGPAGGVLPGSSESYNQFVGNPAQPDPSPGQAPAHRQPTGYPLTAQPPTAVQVARRWEYTPQDVSDILE